MAFLPRSEAELYAMDDGALVRHVAAARAAGRVDQGRTATHMLLFKHERAMRSRVRLRIPRHLAHHADVAGDWVLERVLRSALTLPLEGRSAGEWVKWWHTVVDRQVVSFWRSSLGRSLERQVALASEREDAVDAIGEDLDVDALLARACYSDIVSAALAKVENPMHVAVLHAALWDDRASADVAAEHSTGADNVDQIKRRFRIAVREECERRGVTGS